MILNELTAISPVDGRYYTKVSGLSSYFSEYALIRYRVLIEAEYFIQLASERLKGLSNLTENQSEAIRDIYRNFTENDALHIKSIEKTTNHDVKAVEYFLRERFSQIGLGESLEFIHFGLTSQDINNTAIPLSLKEFCRDMLFPGLEDFLGLLKQMSENWKGIPMLAKTHGQAATPTTVGKEIRVFAVRLEQQIEMLKSVPYASKFGGATGNFNAHTVAYPGIDWHAFGNRFCASLGLQRSYPTTQIEHYDMLAAWCDGLKRIHTILIDFCRDIWTYISMEYFKQKTKAGEVGSSAMPHKVNPIDFENAEGNLGVANALLEHFASKLPISRLQRDLTDSTVLRNLGVPAAHSILSLESCKKGIGKLILNEEAIRRDLEQNWAVVAEAIQTILRRENYPHPYEKLKELTRGKEIDQDSIREFIGSLDVSEDVRQELLLVTPFNYTGLTTF
jgi:adenylosuccinate lyase